MKKYILSSVLALVMIFCISPDASAEEFCALGSYSAGEELNCYITLLPNDAVVTPDALPAGLELVETPGENGKHISLRGKAMLAGDISFNLNVSQPPSLIVCSAEIRPAVPQVTLSGDISCAIGDSVLLEARASTPDAGTLSYQWFSGIGFAGIAIDGATDSILIPDSHQPGNFGYFCRVTNSNNGYSMSVDSEPVYVTVAEPNITGIFVETLPVKLSYLPGESLDPTGLSIRVSFDNGSSTILQGGFDASPAVFSKPGRQMVELSYGGFRCSYYVDVAVSAESIDGIGVLSLPEKTEYTVGDTLDTTGLSIRVYSPAGQFDVSEGLECSPQKFTEAGRQTVTVSYGGKRCSFTVSVKEDRSQRSLKIASLPIRREYSVGDTLDTKGLSLQLSTGGKSELITQGFSCSPTVLSSSGSQTITVSYNDLSTSFSINVKEAPTGLSPSPRPSATASPSASPEAELSPSPSATVRPIEKPEHQAKDLNGLVKVIFAVALLSLASLAGYVLYMQHRGKR